MLGWRFHISCLKETQWGSREHRETIQYSNRDLVEMQAIKQNETEILQLKRTLSEI